MEPFRHSRARCHMRQGGQDSCDLHRASSLPGNRVAGLPSGLVSDICKEIISASLVLHARYSPFSTPQ